MQQRYFKVEATLVDAATGTPLPAGTLVRLYDQDPLSDDLLLEAPLSAEGWASFVFTSDSFQSLDSPDEQEPDLYFAVIVGGKERGRSQVFRDTVLLVKDEATGVETEVTRNLGTVPIKFTHPLTSPS